MKKLFLTILTLLVTGVAEVAGQQIIAGIVSPGNYHVDFSPDTSMISLPVHLGGMTYPPDSIDITIGSANDFILRFFSWGDGGLGGGGGDATVFSVTGETGFRARSDSSLGWPGVYSYFYVADTLDAGDTIKPGQDFMFQTKCYFWSSTYGNWEHPVNFDWVNTGDHFLGFSVQLPQDTLYGWVRVAVTSVGGSYRTTLRDYALDHNPWLGLREPGENEGFTIFPNPAKNMITITNLPASKNDLLTVSTLTGQRLQSTAAATGTVSMDIRHLEPGVYLLFLTGKHPTMVRKLVVQKQEGI